MPHATLTAMALLLAAQVRTEPGIQKASEAKGWLAPTRIRLDVQDRTIAEIVSGIDAQAPGMLAIRTDGVGTFGRGGPDLSTRRYSIREPGTVTFWEAIDRIGRETETYPVTGNAPGRERVILLAPASADRGFAVHDGAFHVRLTGTSSVSNFQFAPHFYHQPGLEQPRADGSSRRRVLAAQMLVMAEPRLFIIGPEELVVREAVDDRGRSLIPSAPWRQALEKSPGRSFPNQEHIAIPLRIQDEPSRRIKRLTGSVTLRVAPQGGAPIARVEVGFDFAEVPLP
jgi:hypothetical protein